MSAILINNFRRLKIQVVLLMVLFTTVSVSSALYISNGVTRTWNVAVSADSPAVSLSDYVNLIQTDTVPFRSELVSGRYDAILTVNDDGSYSLDTMMNDESSAALMADLEGRTEAPSAFSGRRTGTNVLGFLMMFLLLSGAMCMSAYADDRQYGQLKRVLASPVGSGTYLFSQCLFTFCFLFIPAMVILLLAQLVTGISLGFSLPQLCGLVALLCALSAAFSLMLFSLFSNKDDSAKMVGNTILILTSILSGGFYSFDKGNTALEFVIRILPQKAFLTVAEGLEQSASGLEFFPALFYLVSILILFYFISLAKVKRDFITTG